MGDPLCIIPARGTSTNLPKKNFKKIHQKPLVGHTIESAIESEEIGTVVVSTESKELGEISKEYGAEVPFLRPSDLSEPDVLLNEVIEHAVVELIERGHNITNETPLIILQPNVPFTRPKHINTAIRKYNKENCRAVITVTKKQEFFWQSSNNHLEPFHDKRVLRAELEPLYRETGSIYVTNRSILADGDRVGEAPSYVVTDKLSAFEVNSLIDLWLAERIKKGPDIVFRVDGGGDMGMGHIYRCITIARELESVFMSNVTFVITRSHSGGVKKLRATDFEVVLTKETETLECIKSLDPDIIFIDILDTSERYVRTLREMSAGVINLEDLGDGAEHADYVVNALYERNSKKQNQLFGAEYVVVEQEFHEQKSKIHPEVENVLLTFGGSDPSNLSTKVLKQLGVSGLRYQYKLVLGPDFSHDTKLGELSDVIMSQVTIIQNSTNMSDLMRWADVAICSGGRTAYELAATGTPAIVIAHNDREAERMRDLDTLGAVSFLGKISEIKFESVSAELAALDENLDRRVTMSNRAKEFTDEGGLQRILDLVHDIMIG
jgi:spore coat polysaccharide biosynthesis predicted glycosyltransferase SpsG/CMP-N-acetylneuraminic acid synthetase